MAKCTLNAASEEVADFIERYSNEMDTELYERLKTNCIDFVSSEYVIAYHPLEEVQPISVARDEYSRIPKLYGLLDSTAPAAAGITPALNNPNLEASGRGVIVGFIDTGIDYQNPLFRFSDGSSRIIGLWDQTIQPASHDDNPYSLYGTAYTQAQINSALAADDPLSVVPSQDTNGHGTFMAGVGAGKSMPDQSFTGAAPDCMIAAVKLKPAKQYLRDYFLIEPDVPAFQENDIMMAVRYLIQLSNNYRAPVVIYLGVGTSQGDHTGTSPLGLQLLDLSIPYGTAFVTGAGNETGLHHHYLGNLSATQEYEDVEIRVGEGEHGFCLELWGNAPELYTVGFVSPSGEVIQRLPDISGNESTIPFLLDSSTLTVTHIHVESGSGSSLVFIRFERPSAGIWHIRVYPSVYFTGNFHMWLPMQGFVLPKTIFLRPNPDTIVTDPGNSVFSFTIAAYDHLSQQIYIHSGRGFNRSSTIVPVIAAPGVNVLGPMPTRTASPVQPQTVNRPFLSEISSPQNGTAEENAGGTETAGAAGTTGSTGKTGSAGTGDTATAMPEVVYIRKTGTSVAAAIAAGAVADLFSWNLAQNNHLTLSNASVRAFFIRGAQRKPSLSYPSREWGYGGLDLYESFQNL